jgi:ATP-dependent RNA helicase DHX8/PRP22
LYRVVSKFADRESFRLHVREYRQQAAICVAFVTFSDPQLCNDTAMKLIQSQEKCEGKKIQVSLECKASLHIKKGLYELVKDDFQGLIDEHTHAHSSTVLDLKTLKSGHFSLEIRADSPLELAQAKLKFQNVIGGDTLCWESTKNFKVMFTKNGKQRAKEIEKETKAMIIVDERDMTVTIQGLISCRRRAASFIEEYIKIHSGTEETVVRLKGEDNPPGLMKVLLIKYGIAFEDFRKETDVSGIELNLRLHEIAIYGRSEAIGKALEVVKSVKEELIKIEEGRERFNDLPDCPICLCPVKESDICSLEYCGHAYCKVCLTSYIRHAVTGRQLPVSCAAENCNKPLVIRDINTQVKMGFIKRKDLLDSALSCFVNTRSKDFRFCITPDCGMVYRVTKNGKLFFCPTCRTKICTTCHIQYHEGLTCSMYNVAKKEGESMLEWMKEDPSNRKVCPKCNYGIEKTGGCNHMQCSMCKANICWSCMTFFSEVSDYMKHVDSAHGNFL